MTLRTRTDPASRPFDDNASEPLLSLLASLKEMIAFAEMGLVNRHALRRAKAAIDKADAVQVFCTEGKS